MRALLDAWRRFYGANPLHLLALLGCFALAGYVVVMLYPNPSAIDIGIFFAGAVLGHDLLLYPLYALADRSVVAGRWVQRKARHGRFPRVPAINHLRIPVILSGFLLAVFWPSITAEGGGVLLFAAGRTDDRYLSAWLGITAILFLVSAVIYAVRLDRAQVRARSGASQQEGPAVPNDTETDDVQADDRQAEHRETDDPDRETRGAEQAPTS